MGEKEPKKKRINVRMGMDESWMVTIVWSICDVPVQYK